MPSGSRTGTETSDAPAAGVLTVSVTMSPGRPRSRCPSCCPTASTPTSPLRRSSPLVPEPHALKATTAHCSRVLELVAQTAHGDDELRVRRVRLDLGAQALDVDVQRLGVTDVIATPHPVDELHPGQHPARVA